MKNIARIDYEVFFLQNWKECEILKFFHYKNDDIEENVINNSVGYKILKNKNLYNNLLSGDSSKTKNLLVVYDYDIKKHKIRNINIRTHKKIKGFGFETTMIPNDGSSEQEINLKLDFKFKPETILLIGNFKLLNKELLYFPNKYKKIYLEKEYFYKQPNKLENIEVNKINTEQLTLKGNFKLMGYFNTSTKYLNIGEDVVCSSVRFFKNHKLKKFKIYLSNTNFIILSKIKNLNIEFLKIVLEEDLSKKELIIKNDNKIDILQIEEEVFFSKHKFKRIVLENINKLKLNLESIRRFAYNKTKLIFKNINDIEIKGLENYDDKDKDYNYETKKNIIDTLYYFFYELVNNSENVDKVDIKNQQNNNEINKIFQFLNTYFITKQNNTRITKSIFEENFSGLINIELLLLFNKYNLEIPSDLICFIDKEKIKNKMKVLRI